jgi:hypothetical protein|tara:strand:- start:1008 stop:1127 length:120 start_codon:yes stop_codon:yes gene_type:complete
MDEDTAKQEADKSELHEKLFALWKEHKEEYEENYGADYD